MKSAIVIVADLVTLSARLPVRERMELSAISMAALASLETIMVLRGLPAVLLGVLQFASAAICTVIWGPLPSDLSRIVLWLVVFTLWSVCAGTFADAFLSLHHAPTPEIKP